MTHNKKRNTAFLFEALLREQVQCVLRDKNDKAKFIEKLIKQFFNREAVLGKELDLYNALTESKKMNPELAERLISRVKQSRDVLNDQQIFTEQSKLISIINKHLGDRTFNNFVSNYRELATINIIFNKKAPVKNRVFMEQVIKDHLVKETQKSSIEDNGDINMFVLNRYMSNINEEYKDFLDEQKELLSNYIMHEFGSKLDFKIYLNEECHRITKILANTKEKYKDDFILSENINKCLDNIKNIDCKLIDEPFIYQILKYQELAKELSSHD